MKTSDLVILGPSCTWLLCNAQQTKRMIHDFSEPGNEDCWLGAMKWIDSLRCLHYEPGSDLLLFAIISRPWLRFHSSSWLNQAPPPHHVTSTLWGLHDDSHVKEKEFDEGQETSQRSCRQGRGRSGNQKQIFWFPNMAFFLLPDSTAYTSGFLAFLFSLHFLFTYLSSHHSELYLFLY